MPQCWLSLLIENLGGQSVSVIYAILSFNIFLWVALGDLGLNTCIVFPNKSFRNFRKMACKLPLFRSFELKLRGGLMHTQASNTISHVELWHCVKSWLGKDPTTVVVWPIVFIWYLAGGLQQLYVLPRCMFVQICIILALVSLVTAFFWLVYNHIKYTDLTQFCV